MNNREMSKAYTFFWLTGNREVLRGRTPADALNSAGYGNGALRALDFYASGDNSEYDWNKKRRQWLRRKQAESVQP